MEYGFTTAAYVVAAVLFILSLGGLSGQESAKRAIWYGIVGMALAVLATLFGPGWGNWWLSILMIALGFMALVAAVNLRGVGESVKFNVVLTVVELFALAVVIGIGFYAMATKGADFSQLTTFESSSDRNMFAATTVATAIAFFSMVGFEDSVNMAEETVDPVKNFPKMLLGGLSFTGVVYVLVSITAVAIVGTTHVVVGAEEVALPAFCANLVVFRHGERLVLGRL